MLIEVQEIRLEAEKAFCLTLMLEIAKRLISNHSVMRPALQLLDLEYAPKPRFQPHSLPALDQR
jgi:hypothetical protein